MTSPAASVGLDRLAGLARLEAGRHPPGTPERRAAAHLWISATVPPARTIDAVRRAIASYGTRTTQLAALALLDRLAADAAGTITEGTS